VLEAKLEKGRGSVVTLLCQRGVLKVGDYFACGTTGGKVTSLTNSQGQRLQEVNPGVPVLVAGFLELPNAGDSFEAISQAEYKDLARTRFVTEHKSMATTSLSATGATINILFKADTNSSREAVLESIAKLSKKLEKKFNVIVAGVGEVTESDVEFAATTKSTIYTLHVKTEPNALILAHRLGVAIHHYDIIYKLLEALDAVAQGAKEIKKIKTKIGDAVVRQVFNIKGVGVIGGSYVTDGRFSKDGSVVIMRGRKKIGQGAIKSLQRDKKSVKEVHAGYECGFLVDGFNEWEVDDKVECYLDLPEQTKK
jgi:translation initiation factor IF-2